MFCIWSIAEAQFYRRDSHAAAAVTRNFSLSLDHYAHHHHQIAPPLLIYTEGGFVLLYVDALSVVKDRNVCVSTLKLILFRWLFDGWQLQVGGLKA